MKGTLRREAEYAALAAKVKAGTATEKEWLLFENWPRTIVTAGALLTVAPEMSLEQWKAMLARRKGQTKGSIYG